VRNRLKEWKCVLVRHHKNVGKVIEKWEKAGWRLHTYACAGNAAPTLGTNHYLLFAREKGRKMPTPVEAAAAAAAAG